MMSCYNPVWDTESKSEDVYNICENSNLQLSLNQYMMNLEI